MNAVRAAAPATDAIASDDAASWCDIEPPDDGVPPEFDDPADEDDDEQAHGDHTPIWRTIARNEGAARLRCTECGTTVDVEL